MFARALPVLAGLSSVVLAASNSSCNNYVIISTRGTYELQGPSIAFPGMINQTFGNLTGGIEYDTVYPANTSFQINIASDDITRYISAGLSDCPSQIYALLGYSQGASATATLLKSLVESSRADILDAIKAVLVVGNPGHVPGNLSAIYADAEIDEFGGNMTDDYAGALYMNGSGQIPEQYYAQDKVLDICHTRDPVCAPAYFNASFIPYHLMYGGTDLIQNVGAEFLMARLGGGAGNATVSSASASPSATASAVSSGASTSATVPTAAASSTPGASGAAPTATPSSSPSASPAGSAPAPAFTGAAWAVTPSRSLLLGAMAGLFMAFA